MKKTMHMEQCPKVLYDKKYCDRNIMSFLSCLDYHGRVEINCRRVHVCTQTTVQLVHVLVRLTCTFWYVHYMYTDMDSVNHHTLCTMWFPVSNQIDYYLWLS